MCFDTGLSLNPLNICTSVCSNPRKGTYFFVPAVLYPHTNLNNTMASNSMTMPMSDPSTSMGMSTGNTHEQPWNASDKQDCWVLQET